jgi:hypothetical protein
MIKQKVEAGEMMYSLVIIAVKHHCYITGNTYITMGSYNPYLIFSKSPTDNSLQYIASKGRMIKE